MILTVLYRGLSKCSARVDFEKTAKGFVDYLLLDEGDFPIAVLEAK